MTASESIASTKTQEFYDTTRLNISRHQRKFMIGTHSYGARGGAEYDECGDD
jgi:hypothetical protein